MNTTSLPPVAVNPGKNNPKRPENDGSGRAITVAAPAISLILVLGAIVVWFFLVRLQLRRKAKRGYRLNGSKRSHSDSLREGQCRQNGVGPKGKGSSPHTSQKKRGGSSKKKHCDCNCQDISRQHEKSCSCGWSSPQNSSSQVTCNGISTVCTGNSPFCPHSTRMKHCADIHSPDSSMSLEPGDYPLAEHGEQFGLEPRGRSNTCDFIPLESYGDKKRGRMRDSDDMILRGAGHSGVNDPLLPGCSCHPLERFEYEHCSCGLEHPPKSNTKAESRETPSAGLCFSAPSLIEKRLISPC